MKLRYVSITGADDAVEIENLLKFSEDYPFAEWAILLLPEQAGQNRFPEPEWIQDFSLVLSAHNTAMHLCDTAFLRFVEGDHEIIKLMEGFKRIQLNLKFGDVEGRYDPQQLVTRVKESPEWTFILQYGHNKKDVLPLFEDVPNHAVLFDESAGRGISPDSWDKPLNDHSCGYAGGINPDNVLKNIQMIEQVTPDDYVTWIDMETGVRTNDQFDLDKVRRVLEASKPYTL